jgi:uncharacterized integral membrane protein
MPLSESFHSFFIFPGSVIGTILFFFVLGILIVLGIVGAQWEKYKKKHKKARTKAYKK